MPSCTVMEILHARMFEPSPILTYIGYLATKTSEISKMLLLVENGNSLLGEVTQNYTATDPKVSSVIPLTNPNVPRNPG